MTYWWGEVQPNGTVVCRNSLDDETRTCSSPEAAVLWMRQRSFFA